MTKGKSIMGNSILPILPGINVTILSIIFAVLIGLFFYSCQIVDNLKEQMNDIRTKVAQAMAHQVCFLGDTNSFKLEEYYKDDNLNLPKIESKLWELSSVMSNLEIIKKCPQTPPGMGEDYLEKTTIESAEDLLKIITILTYISPYCERPRDKDGKLLLGVSSILRKEYTPEWHNDIIRLNSYISWLWHTRGDGLTKLMSEYDAILIKKEPKQTFRFNYPQFVADFFTQVQFIETQIIPELSEKSYKLNFYENKFKIKTHLVFAFIFAIFMLVAGIFLPLYIHLWNERPYIKEIELVLLIITVLSYFCLLLYFLKKTLELKSI
jgi:hypothetical protein